MKRLLAYLLIVLGLGLTFSVSANAKSLELCWKSLSGDKVWVTKEKNWSRGGSGCKRIHKSENTKLYKEINKNIFKTSLTFNKDKKKKIYSIRKINLQNILKNHNKNWNSWLYPNTKIAKAEPSQTQKVAAKVDNFESNQEEFFCSKKGKTYHYSYTFRMRLGDKCSNKIIYPQDEYYSMLNDYYVKFQAPLQPGDLFNLTDKLHDWIFNNKKPSQTQIAKTEPSQTQKVAKKEVKKEITNVSNSKITKKIIKTDTQDPKVKDISIWEKNVLAAIEKEKSDPYCKLVDKQSSLLLALIKEKDKKDFETNLCIKKSDILKLGEYIKFNAPMFILDEMKNCKSNTCIGSKAGKNVYKIFVQKKAIYHAKYPGDMIKGMAWFEILYQTKFEKLQKILKRYEDQNYKGTAKFKKKDHEREIYSLIKLNRGRVKMRNALGFTLYDDLYEVIEGQWLLAEFLNKDKLEISKVKMTPEMFKRKELIEKYKTVLAKYKKKLDEEKNKKN